jgi:hypothetical protein
MEEDVKLSFATGHPPILERWFFVPPLITLFIDTIPSPPLTPEKPIDRDFDWWSVKRRPVFRAGLIVIVNLEALGTNSGDVLNIISLPENCRVDFSLWVGIGWRRFGAILVQDSHPDAVRMSLGSDDSIPLCSMEFDVGKGRL